VLRFLIRASLLLALALAAALLAARPREARSAARPNLLLISIDTLRADRLSVYGYGRPVSPRLDELAREAVVFDRFFYNGGGTLPSHMTMMTSLHPATHSIGPESAKTLEPERQTLAETLAAAGYATAAFTGGGWVAAKFGFDQGFDRYEESDLGFAASIPEAQRWLEQVPRDRPFFLFLHSYDVHSAWNRLPYDCPGDAELEFVRARPAGFDGCRDGECASGLLAEANVRVRAGAARLDQQFTPEELAFVSDLYDGCVHWTDARLGELFDALRTDGRWAETTVVVLSDHGEEFGEHGQMLHDQGGYEEIAHIPWILKLPGGRAAGRRVGGLAAMVDVMPTLLDTVALRPPAGVQGRSLLRAIAEGRTSRPAVHMYSVLRTASHKYFSDEHRLFDLAADPREIRNLFAQEPALTTRLERQVRDLIALDHAAAAAFSRRAPGAPPVELSDEELARLRALGYLR
jgi:arylsulfatase A-like enzyme